MATPDQEQLDFYSERFDPLAALYAPEVALPDPQARPLDNVYKCRQLLPPDHPEAMVFDPPGTKQNPQKELNKARTAYVMLRQQREEARRNPLQEVMGAVAAGPLLLLRRACAERGRIRVITRHARGVRGTSVGTLVAFDKYMNLILRDVEEEYTVLLRLGREVGPDGRLGRARRRQERRHRSLKQVLVMGDSVVCVQRPPGPAGAVS